jgi:hypothetical protein
VVTLLRLHDVLFSEPAVSRTTWLGWGEPKVHWLTECSHPEATLSREVVNEWYDDLPDPDGRFAHRLGSEVDVDHLQALDELFVHQALRRCHDDVRYEEGGVGPDFRIYEDGKCVLAVEVATLFLREDWNDEDRRHNRLADEVNWRLRPTHGYFVNFAIEAAPSEPAPRHFAKWLETELDKLPPHTELHGVDDDAVPAAVYERNGVRIVVRFLPMKADAATKSDPDGRIVGVGRMTFGFVNSGTRLKDAIGKKGGDRYEIRGIPYVVAIGNRDSFLSGDVVIDGLYGGEAIRFDRRDQSNVEIIRKNDGLFGVNSAGRQARHRRISAVAILSNVVLWEPASVDVALYDNLSPATALPDGLFPATRRFGKMTSDGQFGWRTT